jgi:hypothetical protein
LRSELSLPPPQGELSLPPPPWGGGRLSSEVEGELKEKTRLGRTNGRTREAHRATAALFFSPRHCCAVLLLTQVDRGRADARAMRSGRAGGGGGANRNDPTAEAAPQPWIRQPPRRHSPMGATAATADALDEVRFLSVCIRLPSPGFACEGGRDSRVLVVSSAGDRRKRRAAGVVCLGDAGSSPVVQTGCEFLSEGSSLSPGKRLHHQRSSRHAMEPLSDTSPHPGG